LVELLIVLHLCSFYLVVQVALILTQLAT
jgi:hypothetical protein